MINVKRNDCANLNIVRYIDPEPLFKTTPPHTLPMQSHQTECYDLLYNLVWGAAAMLHSPATFQRERMCHLCTWLCTHDQINMYTFIVNYVNMQDNYVYMQENYVYMQNNYVYMYR